MYQFFLRKNNNVTGKISVTPITCSVVAIASAIVASANISVDEAVVTSSIITPTITVSEITTAAMLYDSVYGELFSLSRETR